MGEIENTIRGLRLEAEQYKTAGMIDRMRAVNAELERLGADKVDEPKTVKQTRSSTQAANRRTS